MISVGAVGGVGGSRGRAPQSSADFILSKATVTTAWGVQTVGTLAPINAPAGAYFVLVEGAAASGDEAGLALVNG